jgi:hypothetical protein
MPEIKIDKLSVEMVGPLLYRSSAMVGIMFSINERIERVLYLSLLFCMKEEVDSTVLSNKALAGTMKGPFVKR